MDEHTDYEELDQKNRWTPTFFEQLAVAALCLSVLLVLAVFAFAVLFVVEMSKMN
jgi:hypothetical protein